MMKTFDPPAEPAVVHQLDPSHAELGAGLRQLFEPLLAEPIPPELERLAALLEARLEACDRTDAPAGWQNVTPLRRACDSGAAG